MKSYTYLLPLFFITACATPPRVITNVTRFGKEPVEKSVFFIKKNKLKEDGLVDECKKGAAKAGVKVVNSPCANCISAVLSAKLGNTKTVDYGSTSSYLGFGVYQTKRNVSNVTMRTANIKLYRSGKEVYGIELASEGSTGSLMPVMKHMCEAGFKGYPSTTAGETITIKMD